MQLNDKLNRLLAHSVDLLGVSEEEAIEAALSLLISRIDTTSFDVENGLGVEEILQAAWWRWGAHKGFTLDELVDDLFGDSPVFSPHKVKIQIGQILSVSGFKRKQVRRSKYDRPLWWFRVSSIDREE